MSKDFREMNKEFVERYVSPGKSEWFRKRYGTGLIFKDGKVFETTDPETWDPKHGIQVPNTETRRKP